MITTEQSKADWDAFRALERKRHMEWFLPKYQELGYQLIKDNIDSPYASDHDVIVKIDGRNCKVDEKARDGDFDDLLVEVLQCMRTGKIGWIYHQIDYLFYASWRDKESTVPSSAYLVDFGKLRDFVTDESTFKQLETIISTKGYGVTLNKKVAWLDLTYTKIATKIV